MKLLAASFFLCAGLCIAYFLVIIGYSGISTSFCGIWLFFAALFIIMGLFSGWGPRRRNEMPRFLPVFIFSSFGLGIAGFALIMGMVVNESRQSEDVPTDYCIVMGARVYPDGISKTLMYRLEKAWEQYRAYPDTALVLCGGQEKGDAVPEALAMYNYLMMKGVPGDSMLIEPQATSTFAMMRAAIPKMEKYAERYRHPKGPGDTYWPPDYIPSVGIITSDYHLLRAVSVALKQGIQNPVPMGAQSDQILFVHQCVRESFALLKDYLMGNFTIDEEHIPFDRKKRH